MLLVVMIEWKWDDFVCSDNKNCHNCDVPQILILFLWNKLRRHAPLWIGARSNQFASKNIKMSWDGKWMWKVLVYQQLIRVQIIFIYVYISHPYEVCQFECLQSRLSTPELLILKPLLHGVHGNRLGCALINTNVWHLCT